MTLPQDHPQRVQLNDEVHARPPDMMAAPLRLSYMVMLSAETSRSRELEMVTELARQFDVKIPEPGANHYSQAFGEFRLRWERHTEFTRYQFMVEGIDDDPFVSPAIDAVPSSGGI